MITRFDSGVGVEVTELVLLEVLGSNCPDVLETTAVLVTEAVADVGSVAVTWRLESESPLARLSGEVQVSTFELGPVPGEQLHDPPVPLMAVAVAGRVSTTVSPVADDGPRFETLSVQVDGVPGTMGALRVFCKARSAAGRVTEALAVVDL